MDLPSDEVTGQFIKTIPLPLKVQVSSKKHFILNLNQYRNTHFLVLNKAKVVFKELVNPSLADLPSMQKIFIVYEVFPPSKRLSDVANFCSIVDKFFSDALVEAGKLPDDNFTVVPQVTYTFGNVDPANPRVDAHIYQLPESTK